MQQPRIFDMQEKFLIGMRVQTTVTGNHTAALWRGFRPRVNEIQHVVPDKMYSMQDYGGKLDLETFTPQTIFDRWAAVETTVPVQPPEGMESYVLPGGTYAVFTHRGTVQTFPQTWLYIFQQWLPSSGYSLNHGPHFEVLGNRYLGVDNPDSEEDVWIPVKAPNK